jgi:hypothetical protein
VSLSAPPPSTKPRIHFSHKSGPTQEKGGSSTAAQRHRCAETGQVTCTCVRCRMFVSTTTKTTKTTTERSAAPSPRRRFAARQATSRLASWSLVVFSAVFFRPAAAQTAVALDFEGVPSTQSWSATSTEEGAEAGPPRTTGSPSALPRSAPSTSVRAARDSISPRSPAPTPPRIGSEPRVRGLSHGRRGATRPCPSSARP